VLSQGDKSIIREGREMFLFSDLLQGLEGGQPIIFKVVGGRKSSKGAWGEGKGGGSILSITS